MPNTTVQLAMGQILVEGGQVRENLCRALRAIDEAAWRVCQIVVLSECLDLGWSHPNARQLAEPIPGLAATNSAGPPRKQSSTWWPDSRNGPVRESTTRPC